MAQAGVYTPGPVIDADVTIRVNGVVREHVSMDWAGDTTGGLPEQVVSAGTGMRSRTGTIHWAQQDVQVEPPHPLRQTGGWPPREGDEVEINATVDTGQGPYSFRRFTGRVGRTTGSLTDGTLTSQITDTLGDALLAPCTIPAMITGDYGKSSRVLWMAFEQAGLGLIPPATSESVLHSLPQGGTSPVIGGGVSFAPGGGWSESGDPLGFSTWDGLLTYTTGAARGSKALVVLGRGSSLWDSELTIRFVGGALVKVRFVKAARKVTMTVAGTVVGTHDYVGSEAVPVLGFRASGSTVRLYLSASGASVSIPVALSAAVDAVWGYRLSAVGVQYTSKTVAQSAAWVGSTPRDPVSLERSALEQQNIGATRSFENVPARAVVDSWSEATLGSVWMDEHGRTKAVARDRLLARPVARTLRVEERVLAGSWSVGDDQVRSRVIVKGQQGALNRPRAGEHRAVVYEETHARGFSSPVVVERFIEAPTEVEWGPISTYLKRAGSQGVGGELDGSWISAVVVLAGEDTERWGQSNGVGYIVSAQRLGQRTLLLREEITAVPGGATAYTRTPAENTNVHPAMRGRAMPIIRAEWVTTWTDYTVTGAARGPAWAPPLEHNADWWLTPEDAQRVADALAAELTVAIPTLSGVQVLWDPTRQIGDVEEWVAVDKAGVESWRARVLVTGYAEAWTGRVPEQSVDVRVISWTDPLEGKTYDDLAAAYARYSNMSGTYEQVYDALPNPR